MGNKGVQTSMGRVPWLASWLTPLLALVAYLCFWPIPVAPQGWSAPKDKGYNGPHVRNERLAGLQLVPLAAGQEGPEYLAHHGDWLYTGLSNGDVLSRIGKMAADRIADCHCQQKYADQCAPRGQGASEIRSERAPHHHLEAHGHESRQKAWEPAELEQKVEISSSFTGISRSISSASGSTATVTVEVCIRPWLSVAGTR